MHGRSYSEDVNLLDIIFLMYSIHIKHLGFPNLPTQRMLKKEHENLAKNKLFPPIVLI